MLLLCVPLCVQNAPHAELMVAAREQQKITELRLEKLLAQASGARPTTHRSMPAGLGHRLPACTHSQLARSADC